MRSLNGQRERELSECLNRKCATSLSAAFSVYPVARLSSLNSKIRCQVDAAKKESCVEAPVVDCMSLSFAHRLLSFSRTAPD